MCIITHMISNPRNSYNQIREEWTFLGILENSGMLNALAEDIVIILPASKWPLHQICTVMGVGLQSSCHGCCICNGYHLICIQTKKFRD